MKRILVGLVWAVLFYVLGIVIVGGIAGAQAGAQSPSVEAATAAGAEAGQRAVLQNRPHVAAVAAVLSLLGSATGLLPGTRRPAIKGYASQSADRDSMQRGVLVACVLAAVVVVADVAWIVSGQELHAEFLSSRLDTGRFANVQLGMSEAEVIAVLGLPAGDYSTGGSPTVTYGGNQKTWLGRDVGLTLFFDDAGKVIERRTHPVYQPTARAR